MSCSLSMVESKLPAGFRFYPRDDELICDYLMNKFAASDQNCSSFTQQYSSSSSSFSAILIDVDLNKCEPWDLPEVACVGGKEWYFYSQRDRKYATGLRTNRATISGYWKATGKDRPVFRMGRHLVGMRKTLVFYRGRAPKGRKTNWVMHEFRLEGPFGPPKISSSKDDWVLCRVFHKSTDEQHPTMKPNSPAGVAHHHQIGNGCAAYSHTCHDGSGPTLPGLMDSSYITFNHKTATNGEDDDELNDMEYNQYNDNKDNVFDNINNNNNNTSQHVHCFSIFSQNPVNPSAPATNFSGQLFNSDLTAAGANNNSIISNNVMISNNCFNPSLVPYNLNNDDCSQANIPAWSSQLGMPPATTPQGSLKPGIAGGGNDGANNQISACDRSVIRDVLSQLTSSSPDGGNAKGNGSSASVVSLTASSESYLSDVGLPTSNDSNSNTPMWNSHGYLLNKMMN